MDDYLEDLLRKFGKPLSQDGETHSAKTPLEAVPRAQGKSIEPVKAGMGQWVGTTIISGLIIAVGMYLGSVFNPEQEPKVMPKVTAAQFAASVRDQYGFSPNPQFRIRGMPFDHMEFYDTSKVFDEKTQYYPFWRAQVRMLDDTVFAIATQRDSVVWLATPYGLMVHDYTGRKYREYPEHLANQVDELTIITPSGSQRVDPRSLFHHRYIEGFMLVRQLIYNSALRSGFDTVEMRKYDAAVLNGGKKGGPLLPMRDFMSTLMTTRSQIELKAEPYAGFILDTAARGAEGEFLAWIKPELVRELDSVNAKGN